MSQDDVYTLLKKHKGQKFTTKQLSKRLGISTGSVTTNCNRLRRGNMIRFKYDTSVPHGRYHYWYIDDGNN